jgi:hypothetical protein
MFGVKEEANPETNGRNAIKSATPDRPSTLHHIRCNLNGKKGGRIKANPLEIEKHFRRRRPVEAMR